MRSYTFLTPLAVNLAIALLILAGRKKHSRLSGEGDNEVFFFPRPYSLLCAFFAVLYAIIPFVPRLRGNANQVMWFIAWLSISATHLLAGLFFSHYKVVLGRETFSVGTFWTRTFRLSDITSTRLIEGRSPEYIVFLRNGGKLRFSGLLADFDRLTVCLGPSAKHQT
ncbi:hypothetical protein [Oleiagrimonas soli]|uniref:DUF304 domain-containing protein n=1 Tax=Oleiagrimonas soli TaxID=1543381 RepID=A0A099CYD8_9GAMM|nr:hypothetical protein [Oleiagrimonas soli]KGI78696.1 hypothetical protein LF63_0104530 [Oleiagrimonas soli]MBB6183982.1 hypothetical protein [Oleiagrimonas soli]